LPSWYNHGMSKAGRPYTFDILEMLSLRENGWSYSSLGRRYHKDHTTIIYHCQKWNVYKLPPQPPPILDEEDIAPPLPPVRLYKYDYILNEPVCKGKRYHEYLAEMEERRRKVRIPIYAK